jgi:hypothetical protein
VWWGESVFVDLLKFLRGVLENRRDARGVFVVSCGGMRGKAGAKTCISAELKKGTWILTLFLN